jgi:uncharacterized protein (TIGR02646 family)
MIHVSRAAKPAILIQKEQDWRNALHRVSTPKAKENAISKYRHKEIRAALETMFHGKCAYCESKIGHVSDAHIEHYRPKSRFPDRTFDWDNLLLACGQCNSARYKGEKFPDVHERGPFINPCEDAPEDHFTFQYDPKTKLANVYGKTDRGKTTEELLGLNREALREYRSRQITRLAFIVLKAHSDPTARELLDAACRDDAEYAAFARALEEALSSS